MLAALVIASCAPVPAAQVERAVMTAPTRTAPASLYFTLRNVSTTPVIVTAVDVDGAGESTMQTTAAHRMPGAPATGEPMVTLMAVDSLVVPPGATLHVAPGGYVVLARRMQTVPAAGDTVMFTVRIANGADVRAAARVLPYAELEAALRDPTAPRVDEVVVPSIAAGRDVYLSNGCAGCHGPDGHGDGPIASSLMPPPRDFRANSPFRNGSTVSDIAQTLATGIPNGGQMPLFAHLADAERRALALYVLSLRRPLSEDTTP